MAVVRTAPDSRNSVGRAVQAHVAARRVALTEGWTAYVPSPFGCTERRAFAEQTGGNALSSLLDHLIADPTRLPGYEVWKFSDHGEVFKATWSTPAGDVDFVAKRRRVAGPWQWALGLVIPSRERRNFHRALTLMAAGIDTAAPLALLEHGGRRNECWLLTCYLPNLVDLDHVAVRILPRLDSRARHRTTKAIIESVADLLRRLDRCRLEHRDLKASNVLLKSRGETLDPSRLWLVDLDGLARNRFRPLRRRWKPVVRLAASLSSYSSVSRMDYCRFLRAYLSRWEGEAEDWKTWFRWLQRRVHGYVAAARRRKVGKLDGYGGD